MKVKAGDYTVELFEKARVAADAVTACDYMSDRPLDDLDLPKARDQYTLLEARAHQLRIAFFGAFEADYDSAKAKVAP